MSNVIPFDPGARKSMPDAAEEVSRRRRESMAAGLRMGFKPDADFMKSSAEAQPYIDALGEAAREVQDDELAFKLRALATALIARSLTPTTKRKKRRRA